MDLNQSQQSFERPVGGHRFSRLSCSFDAIACSTMVSSKNLHATLYLTEGQSTGMPSDQGDIASTELPRSNSDDLGANQYKYYEETSHEMRNPAVDPRKSRRHGTDFGLGRYTESSLTVLNSDHQNPSKATSVSVPLTTTMQDSTATDGDSLSSLFECNAFDFPQPPPIGSPVIRRMHSSPWSSDKDCVSKGFSNQGSRRPRRLASVLSDSDFRGPCYSPSSFVTQQTTMRREVLRSGYHNSSDIVNETTNADRARLHLSPYLDLGINGISLEMVGEALVGLDMNASNLGPQKLFLDSPAYDAPSCELSQAFDSENQFARSHLDWSTSSDLLRWSTSHRTQPLMLAPMSQQCGCEDILYNDGYGGHTFRTKTKPIFSLLSEHQGIRSFSRLPRIIRRVASMRSDTRRPDDIICIPLESTGPRTILKSRSFRSIPLVACEAGNNHYSTITTNDGGLHQHSDWSFANLDCFSSSKDAQNLIPFSPTLNDSLRVFEHCKGRSTQHMSLPSSGSGGLRPEAAQHEAKVTAFRPMALSDPFVYRETCNRSLVKAENDLPNGTDNSFIDITPNQGTKHECLAAASKRARVKKLIARASNGIIGWGRQLTRKSSLIKQVVL